MFNFADVPSLGMWIGLPIALILTIAFLSALIFFLYKWNHDDTYYRRDWVVGILVAAVCLVGTLIITAVAMYPYKHDYHYWIEKEGTVERVSSRLISAGDKGGSNQRFVVVIDGQSYGVDDTRASLLREGDYVKLQCKKEFDFPSTDNGWGCKWGGTL